MVSYREASRRGVFFKGRAGTSVRVGGRTVRRGGGGRGGRPSRVTFRDVSGKVVSVEGGGRSAREVVEEHNRKVAEQQRERRELKTQTRFAIKKVGVISKVVEKEGERTFIGITGKKYTVPVGGLTFTRFDKGTRITPSEKTIRERAVREAREVQEEVAKSLGQRVGYKVRREGEELVFTKPAPPPTPEPEPEPQKGFGGIAITEAKLGQRGIKREIERVREKLIDEPIEKRQKEYVEYGRYFKQQKRQDKLTQRLRLLNVAAVTGYFTLSAAKGFTEVYTRPIQTVKGVGKLITDPIGTGYELGRALEYDPIGTSGYVAGSVGGFKLGAKVVGGVPKVVKSRVYARTKAGVGEVYIRAGKKPFAFEYTTPSGKAGFRVMKVPADVRPIPRGYVPPRPKPTALIARRAVQKPKTYYWAGETKPSVRLQEAGRVYGFPDVARAKGWAKKFDYPYVYKFKTGKYQVDPKSYSRLYKTVRGYKRKTFSADEIVSKEVLSETALVKPPTAASVPLLFAALPFLAKWGKRAKRLSKAEMRKRTFGQAYDPRRGVQKGFEVVRYGKGRRIYTAPLVEQRYAEIIKVGKTAKGGKVVMGKKLIPYKEVVGRQKLVLQRLRTGEAQARLIEQRFGKPPKFVKEQMGYLRGTPTTKGMRQLYKRPPSQVTTPKLFTEKSTQRLLNRLKQGVMIGERPKRLALPPPKTETQVPTTRLKQVTEPFVAKKPKPEKLRPKDLFAGDVMYRKGFRKGMYERYRARLAPQLTESMTRRYGMYPPQKIYTFYDEEYAPRFDLPAVLGQKGIQRPRLRREVAAGTRAISMVDQRALMAQRVVPVSKARQRAMQRQGIVPIQTTGVFSGIEPIVRSRAMQDVAQRQQQQAAVDTPFPSVWKITLTGVPPKPPKPPQPPYIPPYTVPSIPPYTPPPRPPPRRPPRPIRRPPSRPPPPFKLPEFEYEKKKKRKPRLFERSFGYNPSLVAIDKRIRARKPMFVTGLEVRPIAF